MTTQSRLRHARAGGSFRAVPVMTTKALILWGDNLCRRPLTMTPLGFGSGGFLSTLAENGFGWLRKA